MTRIVTRDRDSLHDREFGLANAQGAPLDGVRLGNLFEASITEVGPEGLLVETSVVAQEPYPPFELRDLVDSPLAGFFKALRTAVQGDRHILLLLRPSSFAPCARPMNRILPETTNSKRAPTASAATGPPRSPPIHRHGSPSLRLGDSAKRPRAASVEPQALCANSISWSRACHSS